MKNDIIRLVIKDYPDGVVAYLCLGTKVLESRPFDTKIEAQRWFAKLTS